MWEEIYVFKSATIYSDHNFAFVFRAKFDPFMMNPSMGKCWNKLRNGGLFLCGINWDSFVVVLQIEFRIK